VKWLIGVLLLVVLATALVPELRRYRAERRLRAVTGAFQAVLAAPAAVREPGRVLAALDAAATDVAADLPGDSRPRILAGSTRLVAGDFGGALAHYAAALALGERAEIVLNVGRTWRGRGEGARAQTAFVRAVWVSPPLLDALPDDVRPAVRDAIARAATLLAAGHLSAPPPLP
jgi:cytochrome c-type biogenesis protein CcmH/NrfG